MTNTNTNQTKTETKPSNPATAANPFAAFMPAFDIGAIAAQQQQFATLWSDAMARAHSAAEQFATFEKDMIVRAQGAVATWAQLAQDAIGYAGQLSSEARKMSADAAKKMTAH
jgi:hypothetical protein